MMTFLPLILLQGVFYPSVTEIYQQGKPLTALYCTVPEVLSFASDSRLEQQKKLYKMMPSAALRSDMALWFGKTRNSKSAAILLDLLAGEKNDFVRCDLVKALLNLKKEGIVYALPEDFSRFYEEKNASIAFKEISMRLYGEFYPETAWKSIFRTVCVTTESQLLSTAYPFLKKHAGELPLEKLKDLHKEGMSRGKGSPLHCFAAGLLAGRKAVPETTALLEKNLKEGPLLLRSRIGRGLAENPAAPESLLLRCSRDAGEAVRLETAKIKPATPQKLEILQKLSTDQCAFVREEAYRSLIPGKEIRDPRWKQTKQTVFMTLLQGLKDPVKAVRQAAAASLMQWDLSAAEKAMIPELAHSFAPAWEEVISYAAGKGEKSFAPSIENALDSFREDPVLLCMALQTLGTLRYTRAVRSVMKYAASGDPRIRKSCAGTLGRLKQSISFPVLKKLLRDRNAEVSNEAACAIFTLPTGPFTGDCLWLLKTRTTTRADQRATAVRALDRLKKLPSSLWRDLETLLLKPCIIEPMMPPSMDMPPVRISILMLLHNKARQGEPAAEALLRKALNELSLPQKEDLADPVFDEYFRQFKEFHAGRKVVPVQVDTVEPAGAVSVLK